MLAWCKHKKPASPRPGSFGEDSAAITAGNSHIFSATQSQPPLYAKASGGKLLTWSFAVSEIQLSERTLKVLDYLKNLSPSPSPETGEGNQIWIRQQTLAEHFNCSRRTIGRALKELKEAGLLIDLNKRYDNRCKVYQITSPQKTGLTAQGEQQLKLYRPTFEITFREWPDWIKYYPEVTWELIDETNMHLLWRQTFDKLYVIRDRENGLQN